MHDRFHNVLVSRRSVFCMTFHCKTSPNHYHISVYHCCAVHPTALPSLSFHPIHNVLFCIVRCGYRRSRKMQNFHPLGRISARREFVSNFGRFRRCEIVTDDLSVIFAVGKRPRGLRTVQPSYETCNIILCSGKGNLDIFWHDIIISIYYDRNGSTFWWCFMMMFHDLSGILT